MGGRLIINGKLSNCLAAIYGGDSMRSCALGGSGVQVLPVAYVYDTQYCVTNNYRTFIHSSGHHWQEPPYDYRMLSGRNDDIRCVLTCHPSRFLGFTLQTYSTDVYGVNIFSAHYNKRSFYSNTTVCETASHD